MVLPLLKVVGGAVAHFCPAVSTVNHAGEQAALSGFCPSVALLADLLHLVKDFLLNDSRMGVVEYRLLLNGCFPLLLVPDGVGVGLEINRTAGVFPSFQNMNNGIGVPVVRISGFRTWGVNALSPLIGGRVEHLFRLQEFGDLHRPPAFHTQLKDTLDHRSSCLVHNPLCPILRVFAVAKGDIGRQRDALLALGLLYRTDFAAGILGKKLIEPVFDPRNIVVGAVGVNGVKVVVDGDIAHTIFRKSEVDIQARQRGISPQTGQVFRQHNSHFPRLDF